MSVLVVGLSHKSAPVSILERASVSGDTLGKLIEDVAHLPDIAETFVISTCNRVEVYTVVDRFHGAVNGITELLARYSGIDPAALTPYLYVHYEDRAVQHLLAVASSLDSMVVGDAQILGQVRTALKLAREHGTLGRMLNDLGRTALRAGKRARSEAGIESLGLSLVSVGLQLAAARLAPEKFSTTNGSADARDAGGLRPSRPARDPEQTPAPEGLSSRGVTGVRGYPPGKHSGLTPKGSPPLGDTSSPLTGLHVLVLGAGAMSGLAVATAARSGAARVVVTNRTRKKAERLAAGVDGEVADWERLPDAIAAADLVISCTAASGVVVTEALGRSAMERREAGRDLVMLDLAMPRDIDSAVEGLPGVHVIGMDDLRDSGGQAVGTAEVAQVRAIVAEEITAYGSALRAASVAPTVVALRAKAATVVDSELARLSGRLTDEDLSGHALEEIARTVHRVVDKLLHAPTVRIKELASSPGGEEYADALRVLFDLSPRTVEAVATASTVKTPGELEQEGGE